MKSSYDIAVLGAGFGGSLFAACAAALGFNVLLLERSQHPRFAIGESTSPLANLVLEEIAQTYGLTELLPLTSYGAWKQLLPDITCGLKRGFTYYSHPLNSCRPSERENELLVAASPCNEMADMHWMRAEVDTLFCDVAVRRGVDYFDRANAAPQQKENGWDIHVQTPDFSDITHVQLVVDAGGPRGNISKILGMLEQSFATLPETMAVYSHFEDVGFHCPQLPGGAPYPPDWAAVHHLFPGGWIWSLRFDNGVVSAGAAITQAFKREHLSAVSPADMWAELLGMLPEVERLFQDATPVRPFTMVDKLAWRAQTAAGHGWAMLPSAAASIDPLFSTGIPLTLLGIQRLLNIIEQDGLQADLTAYSYVTLDEAECTAALVGGCYKTMHDMNLFAPLTMLYFAGVSFAETARRVGRSHLANGFMSLNRSQFRSQMLELLENLDGYCQGCDGANRLADDIARIIAPINVAGLARAAKRNWYGVDLSDIVDGADKLNYTSMEMRQILDTADWANGCPKHSQEVAAN
jgi:FADH2 O2-dependent halogenase